MAKKSMKQVDRDLLERVHKLGYEVGYYHHVEGVGWVDEELSEIRGLAKAQKLEDMVDAQYKQGKLEGKKAASEDMAKGMSKTGKAGEEQKRPAVRSKNEDEEDAKAERGEDVERKKTRRKEEIRSDWRDPGEDRSAISKPTALSKPGVLDRTRATERPSHSDMPEMMSLSRKRRKSNREGPR